MAIFPKDDDKRRTGSKGRQIVHSILNMDHWEYKEETGSDVGRDCILELSENDEWHNHKIEGQIKGTAQPHEVHDKKFISVQLKMKTINYALGSAHAFLLFLADTINQIVYYQPIQEYFIKNPELFDIVDTAQQNLNILIPKENFVTNNDNDLQRLARTQYSRDDKNRLEAKERVIVNRKNTGFGR
jgi:hypothetical protein